VNPLRKFLLTAGLVVVVGTILSIVLPGWAGIAVGATALWVFAAGLLLFGRLVRSTTGRVSWVERLLRMPSRSEYRPADLEQLERTLGWKAYSGPDFDYRVRPLLGTLIRHRLRDRHGIDVDADHHRAIEVAGSDLVELTVSQHVGRPTDRTMRTPDIQRLVERIAAL
jgi:hypothetical protein